MGESRRVALNSFPQHYSSNVIDRPNVVNFRVPNDSTIQVRAIIWTNFRHREILYDYAFQFSDWTS
ncbi:hypothetical protein YM3MPS_43860 [Mycobacterium pseudoshottsii]|nr:hypothetical protein [Mycobacterium pseudoshottsii]RFZ61173.1 hypothetical protein DL240490_03564 [Mycobacterium marinum]BEH78583.1 hypothetical protein YM3MPS_43860 [Mycobacterium pseudoshottsii]